MNLIDPRTASVEVDLGALRHNLDQIRRLVAPAEVMAVVKADAYGHGMTQIARAARIAGIDWLGVATPEEALALRKAGDRGRLLAWLYGPNSELASFAAHDIDLTVHNPEQLDQLVAGLAGQSAPARIHLKVDTGLHRNGAPMADWPELCRRAKKAQADQQVEVIGIWSHLATADVPGDPGITAQQQVFDQAVATARELGLTVPMLHLANSAAALAAPKARYDLVRIGIAGYGVDPADGTLAADVGIELRPVMRLRAQLVAVKPVAAGESVSYGFTWTAPTDTIIGLVPLGYADGVPVAGSNRLTVRVGDRDVPVRGRVCMDQFLVDLGPQATESPGDEVTLFGGPEGPRAGDWARQSGTIGYEIITRIGTRVSRIHSD